MFEKSAQFYMGQDMEIVEQFKIEAYERNEADTQITNKREILNRENLKGLAIGSIAAISFAFTGDDIIDSYSSQIIFVCLQCFTGFLMCNIVTCLATHRRKFIEC